MERDFVRLPAFAYPWIPTRHAAGKYLISEKIGYLGSHSSFLIIFSSQKTLDRFQTPFRTRQESISAWLRFFVMLSLLTPVLLPAVV